MSTTNFNKIEQKWQKAWESKQTFKSKDSGKKFYNLEMFPYPSGTGLHMGHALNYIIGDIQARIKRMQGFSVLYPMGYDSFGLPAENAAIKAKTHPKKYTETAIKNFIKQQKSLGLSYDWNKTLTTSRKEYYKWNQYFFLKFLEKGLAYRKKSSVNWCKKCNTVLANEQVHNGMCWRHSDTEVKIKPLEQWFIKTTKYSKELLKLDHLDWPDRIKSMQKNWIGESQGTEIIFKINNQPWKIFTTRPDTIYGVTFMVISAQHSKLNELITKEQKPIVDKFLKKIKTVSEKQQDLEKEGAFTGTYAIHPLTNEKIPVYTGNFVVADYGAGMVMAVPAHDKRDFEFAKKYNIPLKVVIQPEDFKINSNNLSKAYVGEGKLINSDKFNNQNNKEAIDNITKHLAKLKIGIKIKQYKLRDWLISRQRYWGTPIPIIYCESCGAVPVPEKDLPITLPEKIEFGKGNPLTTNKKFLEASCPKCNKKARRETDTMDTFFDSSWYYLRFTDPNNEKIPFNQKIANFWMPVDQYIGGAEHACMHLIYARFFTKALRDLKLLNFDEPFKKLFNQGMLHAEDGSKMSKSAGNVIDPMEISKKYSADALRIYLISVASPDSDFNWSEKGMKTMFKLTKRIFETIKSIKPSRSTKRFQSKLHRSIKEITADINNFKYNLAVIKLRNIIDILIEEETASKQDIENLIKLINPFCPHLSEELWKLIGNKPFISLESWPIYSEKLIDENLEKQEQTISNTLSDINNILSIMKEKNKEIKNIYVYVMPNELSIFNQNQLSKKIGISTKVFAVNDKNKHDPENKSKKAKPGKPGIYIE